MGFLEQIRKELIREKILEQIKISKKEEILKKNWCESIQLTIMNNLKWKKKIFNLMKIGNFILKT